MERRPFDARLRVPLAAAVFLFVALVVLFSTPGSSSGAGGLSETFDGAPGVPSPFRSPNWDIAVTSRDATTWHQLLPMDAMHGPDCGAPPATHPVSAFEDAVFQCNGHIMTAINATGYGLVTLTPDHMVDFSTGEAVIRWDMSTLSLSQRDWVDLWITPFEENLVHPLEDWLPDLQGEPRTGVQLRMDYFNGAPVFRARVVRNHEATDLPGNWWTSYTTVLTPDAKRRDTFELRISATRIKFGMPAYDLWWVDAPLPALGFSRGVVQFGHHSYNPFKDGNGGPNTWHWDNVSISPAVPFTIIKSDRRFVETNGGELRFAAPAPNDAYLRFSGIGTIEVSFDGGATWKRATRQAQERAVPEHFSSYWMPVPPGTSVVQFRGGPEAYQQRWHVKDASIWAATGGLSAPPAPPTNTPTATSTPSPAPTSTATPAMPSATPTAQQTAISIAPQPAGTNRIRWQGRDWYLHGVNMPWYNWACDFGCGANNGVSNPANRSTMAARFAQLRDQETTNVRWWLFPGDPWQVTRGADGAPTAINPSVYADIDAALALAEQYDLYYTFTLFSAPTNLPPAWLTDPARRQQLAAVLGELFARYSGNPRIHTWQVFNEPEWDIWQNRAAEADVVDLVRLVAAQVHARSTQLVSVGSAMADGLPMWRSAGLDYYTAHWYDYMSSGNWCMLCTTAAEIRTRYGLARPIVVGEFYAGSDVPGRFQSFYDKGFAGAWAWSLFPERTQDRMAVNLAEAGAFARARADDGPHALASAPQPTPPPSPTSTATPPPPTSTAPTTTATPSPTPPSTPTAGPTTVGNWTVGGTASRTSVSRGSFIRLTATARSATSTLALVDLELYDAAGNRVYQRYWDRQSFRANTARNFSVSWYVPPTLPPGTYTLKVGVFAPGWTSLHAWNNSAATFTFR